MTRVLVVACLLLAPACAHTPRQIAADTGTATLAIGDASEHVVMAWIVRRAGEVPRECESACSPTHPFVPCFDDCMARASKPLLDAQEAVRVYRDAAQTARAGATLDVAAFVGAIVDAAKAVK